MRRIVSEADVKNFEEKSLNYECRVTVMMRSKLENN